MMKKYLYVFLCLGVITGCLGDNSILTKKEVEEMRQGLADVSADCLKEYGLTFEGIRKMKESGKKDDIDPCFLRCVLKKSRVMNEDGMYDHAFAKSNLAKYIKDDDRLNALASATEKCVKVNDEEVSAGTQGECERAVLFIRCIISVKKELGMFE